MNYNWIPIQGTFEVEEDLIIFKGKSNERPPQPSIPGDPGTDQKASELPTSAPSVGLIICDQELISGTVSAEVELPDVDAKDEATCQLVVPYDVETQGLVGAGINALGSGMFSIREWTSGIQAKSGAAERGTSNPESLRWSYNAVTGDRSNLKANFRYAMEVTVFGSRIVLYVNGVQVAIANTPMTSNHARPTGIFCVSSSDIRISHFRVEAKKAKAFIVMQFSQPYDQVYSEVIKNACAEYGLEPIRGDEIYEPGIIVQDVIREIVGAQLIIADITPENANVYFEVGYALALNKPIILLARKGTPLPFDVSAFRVLFYEDSIGGKAKVEQGLRSHLGAILGRRGTK